MMTPVVNPIYKTRLKWSNTGRKKNPDTRTTPWELSEFRCPKLNHRHHEPVGSLVFDEVDYIIRARDGVEAAAMAEEMRIGREREMGWVK